MSNSYMPARDDAFNAWQVNFTTLVVATPTAFGLVAGDVSGLGALSTGFVTALATATNPATRTKVTVASKQLARQTLAATVRFLVLKIQGSPSVTVQQKLTLGITVKDSTVTPIPPPNTRPLVAVLGGSVNRTMNLRIVDELTPDKKARPHGYDGALVFTYVPKAGEAPPSSYEDWRCEGLAKRADFEIGFRPEDVGKNACIMAIWAGSRGELGPQSAVVNAMVAA